MKKVPLFVLGTNESQIFSSDERKRESFNILLIFKEKLTVSLGKFKL